MNIHIAEPDDTTDVSTLIDASDQLTRIKHLVEAIFMAAFDVGDIDKTSAIQAVVECAHGEIGKLEDILEAMRRKGGAS